MDTKGISHAVRESMILAAADLEASTDPGSEYERGMIEVIASTTLTRYEDAEAVQQEVATRLRDAYAAFLLTNSYDHDARVAWWERRRQADAERGIQQH